MAKEEQEAPAAGPAADPAPPDVPVRTLADLAHVAGVSTGTVSRALAGKNVVNAETRDRIRALARHYGFRPNQMASRLRTQRTCVIGLVIPLGHARRQQISDPFFLTLLGHLADALTERGYDLMLSRAEPDGTPDWLERMTMSGMVDGVCVIGQSDQFDIIEHIAAGYRPMVAWGHYRPGQAHCAVGTDNRAGGRMAADHLIAGGARRLAFLGGTGGIEIAVRLEGAREAAAAAGIELVHVPITLAQEGMSAQIREGLAAAGPLDGIVAGSDLIAMSTLPILREAGRSVPGDVQVIGYDDLDIARQAMPPLTTIRQDIAAGAAEIVARLIDRVEGREADSLVMRPQLIVRESTRPG